MGDKHKGHKHHLCSLIAAGDGLDEIIPLVIGAKVICKSCGRAAIKKKYVCKPTKLRAKEPAEAQG